MERRLRLKGREGRKWAGREGGFPMGGLGVGQGTLRYAFGADLLERVGVGGVEYLKKEAVNAWSEG